MPQRTIRTRLADPFTSTGRQEMATLLGQGPCVEDGKREASGTRYEECINSGTSRQDTLGLSR